jgi:hypothetical protein
MLVGSSSLRVRQALPFLARRIGGCDPNCSRPNWTRLSESIVTAGPYELHPATDVWRAARGFRSMSLRRCHVGVTARDRMTAMTSWHHQLMFEGSGPSRIRGVARISKKRGVADGAVRFLNN